MQVKIFPNACVIIKVKLASVAGKSSGLAPQDFASHSCQKSERMLLVLQLSSKQQHRAQPPSVLWCHHPQFMMTRFTLGAIFTQTSDHLWEVFLDSLGQEVEGILLFSCIGQNAATGPNATKEMVRPIGQLCVGERDNQDVVTTQSATIDFLGHHVSVLVFLPHMEYPHPLPKGNPELLGRINKHLISISTTHNCKFNFFIQQKQRVSGKNLIELLITITNYRNCKQYHPYQQCETISV